MATILCLHGWTMDCRVWADAARRLAPPFRVLAPDLPGHGAARGHALSIDGAAEALAAVVAAEGRVTLVGWSMGATVAWRYLARFGPARVAGMVALDMSPRVLNGPGWSLGLRGADGAAPAKVAWLRGRWPEAAPMIAHGMYGAAGTAPLLPRAEAEARIAACDPAAMAEVWASLLEADERRTVARLAVPMLVIHGAQSRLYPAATAEWLEAAAPRATRVCFAASGHSPHLEEPERFADILGAFAAALQPT
ncbi:MAG: alpha/beta fold hydrolase [Gemmobacter sp.]